MSRKSRRPSHHFRQSRFLYTIGSNTWEPSKTAASISARSKVTPRSKGDNVVEGTINIVEDWWSIHSLDFDVTKLGIAAQVKQIYNPIEDKVWMPISQTFKVTGKVFGFESRGKLPRYC